MLLLFFFFCMGLLIAPERALRHVGEQVQPFVDHVPHAHGQMVPVPPVQRHALEAVAVVRAALRAGAVVP